MGTQEYQGPPQCPHVGQGDIYRDLGTHYGSFRVPCIGQGDINGDTGTLGTPSMSPMWGRGTSIGTWGHRDMKDPPVSPAGRHP